MMALKSADIVSGYTKTRVYVMIIYVITPKKHKGAIYVPIGMGKKGP